MTTTLGSRQVRQLFGTDGIRGVAGDFPLTPEGVFLIGRALGHNLRAGSTNPRPKWFLRRLASFENQYTELRRGLLSWMHGARHTDLQKREGIDTACGLIDSAWLHIRSLLNTAPECFRADEALALADRELATRNSGDREAAEEFQLLQRIFDSAATPLSSQLNGNRHRRQPAVTVKSALG